MKYGKFILAIIFVLLEFFQVWFSGFEDKMYCDITKDKIVISLDNKNFYTCKVYTRYIEVQMKKVYRDIILIQKYIDKRQDLGYWKPLKNEKVVFLNLLQNMRLNILSHMKTFETNLFETAKGYFLDSIYDYKRELLISLGALRDLKDPSWKEYIVLLEQQLSIIETISESTTYEQLNENIKKYVYLKKQLPWK